MSLSDHQIFMLKHFAMGWKFKQYNDKPGSWNTYWSLRRRNLIKADSVVTEQGRKVLAKELQLQAARQAKRAEKLYGKGAADRVRGYMRVVATTERFTL